MASITQDQIKVLEQTRQRLVQLTQSLGSLTNSISQSDPLPPWSSLQSQASIISNNLVSISHLLTEHQHLFSSLVAYPTPTFPGHSESAMLTQLMRTKLEPRVEEWVAKGRNVARDNAASSLHLDDGDRDGGAVDAGGKDGKDGKDGLSVDELLDLWHWAPIEANMEARRRNWGGDYTLEEKEMGVENVVTGLKRKLNEGDEEEEDEYEEEEEEGEEGGEGESMQIVGAHLKAGGGAGVEFEISREGGRLRSEPVSNTLPLDDVFRFMMTGSSPRSR